MRVLVLVLLTIVAVSASAEPERTYLLDVRGNEDLAAKLIEELTSKPCFTIADVRAEHPAGGDCHAFKKFENEKDIRGDLRSPGPTFLYKVRIFAPEKYNLQVYQRDGKKLRRILNAGDFRPAKFTPPQDFFAALKKTTVSLTFK